MAKPTFQSNPRVQQIFEDLEKYKDFCVSNGFVYDESTLYDMRSYVYRQHTKQLAGKYAKNNWVDDSK